MKRQNISLLAFALILPAALTNALFVQGAYPFDYPESSSPSVVSEPAAGSGYSDFSDLSGQASGFSKSASDQATALDSFPASPNRLLAASSGPGIGSGYAAESDFQTDLPPETYGEPIIDGNSPKYVWGARRAPRFSYADSLFPGIDPNMGSDTPWSWYSMPDNIIYKTYMACKREPRMGIQFVGTNDLNYWDCSLGARVSLLRYGTNDPLYPEGFELEIDGAAFPRLTLDDERELWSCDYRFGVPLAYRRGHWEYMFGYYHISSHMGDERMVRYNSLDRLNYVRDCAMAGIGFRPNYNWRYYFHAEYAFWRDGGAKPWHLIFGIDYSPMETNGFHGAPFFAVCGRLREDIDFSGSFSLEAGWQWRSAQSHVFRTGLFYLNGYSDHYQFYKQYEQQIGLGFWYDF